MHRPARGSLWWWYRGPATSTIIRDSSASVDLSFLEVLHWTGREVPKRARPLHTPLKTFQEAVPSQRVGAEEDPARQMVGG